MGGSAAKRLSTSRGHGMSGRSAYRGRRRPHRGGWRIACDLEVTLPHGATIEGRGSYGDYDVNDVAGSVDISSGNAGVRLTNIGGNAKVDLQRSDIVRAVDVKGDVNIEGRGSEIELENIAGQVTVNGSYSGTLQFKNLAKPLHLESRNTGSAGCAGAGHNHHGPGRSHGVEPDRAERHQAKSSDYALERYPP